MGGVRKCRHLPFWALAHSWWPSYNTPPCEVSMPFSIRPFRRFPVQCSGPYHAGLFLTLQPAYFLSFGSVVTLLVLGHGPAYGEWVSVSGNV